MGLCYPAQVRDLMAVIRNVWLCRTSVIAMVIALSACAPGVVAARKDNMSLLDGPPIQDITTPFSAALACLSGKVPKLASFSVSLIADNTGKEQYADGGTGKLITQGAGDMVQSALFEAGVRVVNRRDPNIAIVESNWGLRSMADQIPSDFFISGSINSLDVIPGGGVSIEVAGVGPRYRQTRILIGLDLALTNAHDGQIVANASVQKQLFASELGFGADRFLDTTLVNVDIGALQREAMHYTLRQMLAFATFDLIAQVLDAPAADGCVAAIRSDEHRLMDVKSYAGRRRAADGSFSSMMAAAAVAPATVAAAAAPAGAAPQAASLPGPSSPPEARKLANDATTYAAQAIASAQSAVQSVTYDHAAGMANNAIAYMQLAVKALREAAAAGLTGIEGDTSATLVQQAVAASQEAQNRVMARADAPAPAPAAATETDIAPVDPQDKRLGGPGN